MLSYWEKQSLLHYDVLVVGGGIVGLSTAASIKEKNAALSVAVLERAILPTGASTKNAGFACIGSLTEILDDLNHSSSEEVIELLTLRYKGLHRLRHRLGDAAIGYAAKGSYELLRQEQEHHVAAIDDINKLLLPALGANAFRLSRKRAEDFGFSADFAKVVVQNNLEGELHTGKMMRALMHHCTMLGAEIKTGCEVSSINEESNRVVVRVASKWASEDLAFTCAKVAVCTNAFTPHFFPDLEIQPGRGMILLTEPVPQLHFQGIFHFDKGYYYFRNVENRVLLGGGRNADFLTESTTEFSINQKIKTDLLHRLKTDILPAVPFQIADEWVGIMAFGKSKRPIVAQRGNRVFLGARLGGMGVAIGSEMGEQLATLILENR